MLIFVRTLFWNENYRLFQIVIILTLGTEYEQYLINTYNTNHDISIKVYFALKAFDIIRHP